LRIFAPPSGKKDDKVKVGILSKMPFDLINISDCSCQLEDKHHPKRYSK
jgi:hypothetical protein